MMLMLFGFPILLCGFLFSSINIFIFNIIISDKDEIKVLKKNFMAVYGMDYVNASRVLKAKYRRNRNNKDGMTLAERIKNGRYGSGVSTVK